MSDKSKVPPFQAKCRHCNGMGYNNLALCEKCDSWVPEGRRCHCESLGPGWIKHHRLITKLRDIESRETPTGASRMQQSADQMKAKKDIRDSWRRLTDTEKTAGLEWARGSLIYMGDQEEVEADRRRLWEMGSRKSGYKSPSASVS